MKHRLVVLILLAGLAYGSTSQESQHRYTVYYMGVPVLNVRIASHRTGDTWEGSYQAKIKAALAMIYPIENQYTITADPELWIPRTYRKQIREGKFTESQVFRYNTENHKMTLPNQPPIAFPEKTHSLFSALLWTQFHAWTPGETVLKTVEIDGALWDTQIVSRGHTALNWYGKTLTLQHIRVRFLKRKRQPALRGRTDYLSKYIASKNRIIDFWIDTQNYQIYQIIVPMSPFDVKAIRNPG